MADNQNDGAMKIEKLNGTNYQTWKFNVKLMLMQKELWGIVDGTDVIGDNSETEVLKKKFYARSDKAYSIIALSIETSLQVHIMNTTNPKDAWGILEKQFSFVSITQLVRLTRKFYAASMQEGEDLLRHVTYMTKLAQELRDLKEDINPKKFATVILGSLPSSYDMFVTSLNAREADNLDWESIKGPLVEEFMKRKETKNPANMKADDALFTRGGGGAPRYQQGSRPGNFHRDHMLNNMLSNNNRGNHNRNMNGRNQQSSQKRCFKCGDPTHMARDCNPRNNDIRYDSRNREDVKLANQMGQLTMNSNRYYNDQYPRQQEESRFMNCIENSSINYDLALITGNHVNENSEWFIDSAASKHMTSNKSIITDYTTFDQATEIFLGDDSVILAEGEGTVLLPVYENNQITKLNLHNVLYVPDLSKNLVSVTAMTKTGAEVYFDDKKCMVHKDDKRFVIGHAYHEKLYRMNTKPEYATLASAMVSSELWHKRLGHLNKHYMDQLLHGELATGITYKNTNDVVDCEPCILGKMQRNACPKSSDTHTQYALELVHSDLCGPIQEESFGGSKYILTFTDDFTRYVTVYFLHKKSQVFSYYKQYVTQMENLTGNKLKKIRTDNGGEYTSNQFFDYCKEMGYSREFSVPHTPEQNGVAERLNRTIVEAARSMLIQAKLPISFWAEAISCAVYIRNRSPTAALNNKTPYECWFGQKPDLSNLRVFGCVAYAHVPTVERRKLDPKAVKCIFVGYPEGTKGYRLFNLSSNRFIRSRSVIFHEEKFHDFNTKLESKEWINILPDDDNADEIVTEEQHVNGEEPYEIDVNGEEPYDNNENQIQDNNDRITNNHIESYEESFLKECTNLQKRNRVAPRRLIEDCLITESMTDDDEPKSLQDALKDENWMGAMRSEMNSHAQNVTWELVPRPINKNIVGNRWVFKVKRDPVGTISRHKARLVAQGYSQVHGIDYEEIFSPVAKFATIRTLLAFANINDLEVHQMDVKTAFLNGILDHQIYMEQPKGFVDPVNQDYVCKLNKSIYGLKQSARCWNSTLTDYLISEKYEKCDADDCIYIKYVGNDFIMLAVYVDDVIPISNNLTLLEHEKLKLKQKFDMVDNGNIDYILGMSVKRDRANKLLSITQEYYLINILKRFNMQNCNSCSTPLEMGTRFHKFDEDQDERCDMQLYQQAIGCLTYAAITTRPDISAAVGILSQYMSAPSTHHWSGVKRVLRYIKGTQKSGLIFSINDTNELLGYSDADWAGDTDTRRSTSGYTFHLGQALISWSSRKQATVAKSSTEAEYVALSCATQEAIWLRRLLKNIKYSINSATIINEDNQGAIELSKNPKHHNRTKHIDTSFHFIRERVTTKEIDITYCPSNEMIADIMTKALPKATFEKFRNMLGIGVHN